MAAMTFPDVSQLQGVGGSLVLAGLFVLRQFVSGAIKEAGQDAWGWIKTRHSFRRRRSGNRSDDG
jgi:hypothetical protein